MMSLHRWGRYIAVVSLVVGLTTSSNSAQGQPSSAHQSQLILEALALRGADTNDGKQALAILCKNLPSDKLVLTEFWAKACPVRKVPADAVGCVRGYFNCLNAQATAGSTPSAGGAPVDCEARLKQCQIKK